MKGVPGRRVRGNPLDARGDSFRSARGSFIISRGGFVLAGASFYGHGEECRPSPYECRGDSSATTTATRSRANPYEYQVVSGRRADSAGMPDGRRRQQIGAGRAAELKGDRSASGSV